MKQAGQFWLPEEDSYFEPFLAKSDGFQLDHLAAALEYVDEWACAIDGGAHVGTWAKRLAVEFAEVHAFEPAEDTFECLTMNLGNEPNVVFHRQALGQKSGYCQVIDDVKRVGNTGSRFVRSGEGKVNMMTLDKMEFPPLGFVKLDLEGYEYFAVLGAAETLMKHRPVVMVEEKGFGARYDVPAFAASNLLKEMGAHRIKQVGKDHIFMW